jgi:hypothetical protein
MVNSSSQAAIPRQIIVAGCAIVVKYFLIIEKYFTDFIGFL